MAGAIIIGEETWYGTWAGLRDTFALPDLYDYSRDYPVMNVGTDVALKSAADGSGLIRADFNSTVVQYPTGNFGVLSRVPTPPDPVLRDYWLRLYWWDAAASPQSTFVPIEIQTQLTGQTVTTSNSVSFTITSDLFTNTNGEQKFLSLSATNPGVVVSVGKLTPIT